MENINVTEEMKEVLDHMDGFTGALAHITRRFVRPIDPNECPEAEQYVRDVLNAVDNVVLVAMRLEGEALEVARAQLLESTEMMIAELSMLHKGQATTH